MTELDMIGLGVWSTGFSNWREFVTGMTTGTWQSNSEAQPALMPARERRRAPQSVKMAVEVMDQACNMASLNPTAVASVFTSSAGDTQITDYMCRTLSTAPRLLSPTRFHNSVHNAAVGYWSIATRSHAASNAISAFSYSAPMAFLEAAIQVTEEEIPVLLVTQEVAAPRAMLEACPAKQPFSAALLLAPVDYCAQPISTLRFTTAAKSVNWPEFPESLRENLADNPGAGLLPLLAAVAEYDAARSGNGRKMDAPVNLSFPLSEDLCLNIELTHFPPA